MAYLLRLLILLMVIAIALTIASAMGHSPFEYGHIQIAIPSFIYLIFAQAFCMFFLIGVSRFIDNIYLLLHEEKDLTELFEEPPKDLTPYKKRVDHFRRSTALSKRQTIPWTMLMLVLGMAAFLLGGAHDTGLVAKTVHVGLVYGFTMAMLIGAYRQWVYLGKSHKILRDVKSLFNLEDGQM